MVKRRCLKNLQDAGLSRAVETILPHISCDGSTAILATLAKSGVTLLVEGPEKQLPAMVLDRVQRQEWPRADTGELKMFTRPREPDALLGDE